MGVAGLIHTRSLWLLLALAAGGPRLDGQSIVEVLAGEICRCLENGPLIYPRVQVKQCVDATLEAHPRRIRNELQLSVRNADDRRQLEDLILDPLITDCSLLRELPPAPPTTAPRYSDLELVGAPTRSATKHPPPDGASRVVRSTGGSQSVVARLVDANADRWMLETSGGESVEVRLPATSPTIVRPSPNAYHRFYFELDWRGSPERVTRRLTGVKSLN